MDVKIKIKFSITITLVFVMLCTSAFGADFNSFEDLVGFSDIIKIETVEIDTEYLEYLEVACDDLRQEYMEYVEYQHETSEVISVDKLLCYKIRYQVDYAKVVGYICAPSDYQTADYPVLIYNRGGNGSYGSLADTEPQHIARYGFIVLATQYRGVDGGTGMDEFGGADVADVIKLIDIAETFTFTDAKIYMFGWSRGAMQTYIVLSRDDRITAAVAGAGPTDILKLYCERGADMQYVLESRVGLPETHIKEYEARSAVYWPEKINTPLFIAHGTADESIGVHHSQDLFDDMSELGKDVKFMLYPDMDHSEPFWAFMGDYFYWLKQH